MHLLLIRCNAGNFGFENPNPIHTPRVFALENLGETERAPFTFARSAVEVRSVASASCRWGHGWKPMPRPESLAVKIRPLAAVSLMSAAEIPGPAQSDLLSSI